MNLRTRNEAIDPKGDDPDQGARPAELASRRTTLAFQRTRMSADRTLMAVIRTSLSLIGFGFTIYQFFGYLRETAGAMQLLRSEAQFRLTKEGSHDFCLTGGGYERTTTHYVDRGRRAGTPRPFA